MCSQFSAQVQELGQEYEGFSDEYRAYRFYTYDGLQNSKGKWLYRKCHQPRYHDPAEKPRLRMGKWKFTY